MDNKPKPGTKGPRGKRSKDAIARRAQRPAGIRYTALAQMAKAQTELDEREAKVVTLQAMVVRQSKAFRAEAVKFREVWAQVITSRATQSHAPDTVWYDRVHSFKWLPPPPSLRPWAVGETPLLRPKRPSRVWRLRPLSALSPPSLARAHHVFYLASRHFVSVEQVPTNIQHQSYLTGFVASELEKLERQMDNSRYSAGKLIGAMPAIYATAAALKDAKGPAATDIQRAIKWQLGELGAQLLQDKVEHADLTKAIATCARNVHSAGVVIGKLGYDGQGQAVVCQRSC